MPRKQAENNSEISWSDSLRQAIAADKRSAYALCNAAGIERSMLARFMAGKSINLQTAEKLGRVVGLRIERCQ